jgi:hypothetical protein
MTRPEFIRILEPLKLAMLANLDAPTLTAYYRVLEGVPAVLLEQAVADLLSQSLEFFPKAPEIRAACEMARRRQLALVPPYDGCVECEDQKGWRPVKGADGYVRLERCGCRLRYQERLADRGLLEAVSQLPGEAEPQGESYHPTAEQLPSELRAKLLETVRQKVLR